MHCCCGKAINRARHGGSYGPFKNDDPYALLQTQALLRLPLLALLMPLDSEKNLLPMARVTPETPEAEDKERGFSPTPNSLKAVDVERTICDQEADVSDDTYVMDPIAEKK